jgi:hypothetical protein
MARRAWLASLLLVAIFAGCAGVGVHRPDLRRQIDYGANDYVALSRESTFPPPSQSQRTAPAALMPHSRGTHGSLDLF